PLSLRNRSRSFSSPILPVRERISSLCFSTSFLGTRPNVIHCWRSSSSVSNFFNLSLFMKFLRSGRTLNQSTKFVKHFRLLSLFFSSVKKICTCYFPRDGPVAIVCTIFQCRVFGRTVCKIRARPNVGRDVVAAVFRGDGVQSARDGGRSG